MHFFPRWLSNPSQSFRVRLSGQITAIIWGLTFLFALIFSTLSSATLTQDRGQLVKNLAVQMASTLDYEMYIHVQEIRSLAKVDLLYDTTLPRESRQVFLANLQEANPFYAWIGLTSPEGIVVLSTDGLLEGLDVSDRPWFRAGHEAMTVQDVHIAKLLAELVPNPSLTGEPLRFIDIATPLVAEDGTHEGVLGAHLYWQWATRLRDRMAPLENQHQVEIILLSNTGEVLLAPRTDPVESVDQVSSSDAAVPQLAHLASYQQAAQGLTGYQIENWFEQEEFLTGFSPTQGYQTYPGLGWIVLVRQPLAVALAPAQRLQRYILVCGLGMGGVSGLLAWWLAGTVTGPVLRIAQAADRMSQGDRRQGLPIITGWTELAVLSQSIAALFANLDRQNQRLETFNTDLEHTVQHRTEQLHQVNQKLLLEVEERKQAQSSLEVVNQELKRLTISDGLTRVANRRYFDQYFQQEWERAHREQQPLSLLMIDVDFFKAYNDTYGHIAGDHCLRCLATTLATCAKRPADLVARYGGEEFALILPSTSHYGALYCAQSIHTAVSLLHLPHQGSSIGSMVTVSIGAATLVPPTGLQPSDLLQQADQNLYQAKRQGRNRTVGLEPYPRSDRPSRAQ